MRSALVSILATAVMACSGENVLAPPLGFSHAVAKFDCGPVDQASVTIILSRTALRTDEFRPPSPPYLQITIYEELRSLTGSWVFKHGNPNGFAAMYRGTEVVGVSRYPSYEVATGVVRVSRVLPDNRVQGSIHLFLPTYGELQGGFDAPWISTPSNVFWVRDRQPPEARLELGPVAILKQC
ncbi:MAG: hypothetical protein ACRENU_17585 [Gemmatimonadaceae bacterium]